MTTNSWMEIDITCGTKIHALRAGTPLLFVTWLFKIIFEVNYHVYVKCQTRICTTWPSFPFTCRLLFIISSHRLVVLRNFLSIRIVLSCFYLLIFYFEKFSTGIWRLPFALYVKPLKTSYRYVAGFFSQQRALWAGNIAKSMTSEGDNALLPTNVDHSRDLFS